MNGGEGGRVCTQDAWTCEPLSQGQLSLPFSCLRFPPECGVISGHSQALFRRNFQPRVHAKDGSWKRNFEACSKQLVNKETVK